MVLVECVYWWDGVGTGFNGVCGGGPNVVWCVYRWIVCGSLWVGQCVSVGVLVGRLCVGVDLACCEAVFWGGLCVCGRWVGCWLMTYM